MKKLLSALVVLALCSGAALATVPDATNCTVTPCDQLGPTGIGGVVVCPGTPSGITAAVVTVVAKNAAGNVIPNASVVISMGSAQIVGCTTLPWVGTCDLNGVWTKTFSGGGCFSGAGACVVTINGVPIRTYVNVKSPDWDGGAGNLIVQANDLSTFATGLATNAAGCSDMNNSGGTNIADFVIFVSGYTPSHNCP
jgi:hypothetical protein